MNQRHKIIQLAVVAFLVFGAVAAIVMLRRDLNNHLRYPPGPDQDVYLEHGRQFIEQGVVVWRTPLYSIWIGGLYVLSGKNVESTFWTEKFISVLLFAGLCGLLGSRLFGWLPGSLMTLWALNCKYLIIESNGTHTLATSFAMGGALCFFLPNRSLRLPLAMLMLFLSTQVRQDMWVPFLTFCVLLVALFAYQLWRGRLKIRRLPRTSLMIWFAAIVFGAAIYAGLSLRTVHPEPRRINTTFGMYYAYQYVHRHNLQSKYPKPFDKWLEIIHESMPDLADPALMSPLNVARKHPSEFMAHIFFNLKSAARAVPAMAGGLMHPFLFVPFAFLVLGLSLLLRRPGSVSRFPLLTDTEAPVWLLAISSLIPLGILMAPAARTLIPLIPVEMIIVGFLLQKLWHLVEPLDAKVPSVAHNI